LSGWISFQFKLDLVTFITLNNWDIKNQQKDHNSKADFKNIYIPQDSSIFTNHNQFITLLANIGYWNTKNEENYSYPFIPNIIFGLFFSKTIEDTYITARTFNNPNLYSVSMIAMLKFQQDKSTRTKVIAQKPLCLQTEDNDDDRTTT
jgi:hypothetical protein